MVDGGPARGSRRGAPGRRQVQVDLRGHADPDRSGRGQARPVELLVIVGEGGSVTCGTLRWAPQPRAAAAGSRCGRSRRRRAAPRGRRVDCPRPAAIRSAAAGDAGPAGQRGPQRLAALGERGVDHGEHLARATAVVGGRLAPGERDQARVDVRHRPEDARRTVPARCDVGVPGEPSRSGRRRRGPGPAASRSATSVCTITRPVRSDGRLPSRCSSTGTATLYGRFATSAVGAASGSASTRSASRLDHLQPVGVLRARARRPCPAAACASTGSISTAHDLGRRRQQPEGERAEPRPDLEATSSSGRARRRARCAGPCWGRWTKFCPSCLVGRTPSAAASSRISAGPSRRHRQSPNARVPLAEIAAHSASRSCPVTSARARTVSGIR